MRNVMRHRTVISGVLALVLLGTNIPSSHANNPDAHDLPLLQSVTITPAVISNPGSNSTISVHIVVTDASNDVAGGGLVSFYPGAGLPQSVGNYAVSDKIINGVFVDEFNLSIQGVNSLPSGTYNFFIKLKDSNNNEITYGEIPSKFAQKGLPDVVPVPTGVTPLQFTVNNPSVTTNVLLDQAHRIPNDVMDAYNSGTAVSNQMAASASNPINSPGLQSLAIKAITEARVAKSASDIASANSELLSAADLVQKSIAAMSDPNIFGGQKGVFIKTDPSTGLPLVAKTTQDAIELINPTIADLNDALTKTTSGKDFNDIQAALKIRKEQITGLQGFSGQISSKINDLKNILATVNDAQAKLKSKSSTSNLDGGVKKWNCIKGSIVKTMSGKVAACPKGYTLKK